MLKPEILVEIVPGFDKADEYAPLIEAAMERFSINTTLRSSMFLAQVAHESGGFRRFVENLNYSARGLQQTWPSHFPMAVAEKYARQPERIANRAYALRMGNGDEASGDGWKYRGQGAIQITGRESITKCLRFLGLDASQPEVLQQPEYAFLSAGWFWETRGLNPVADSGDFKRVTKLINGGLIGLTERVQLWERAKKALA
jgi:putative chitinase